MNKWVFLWCCLVSFITHAEPLPVAEAFQFNVKPLDPNTFTVNWQLKPGYFLYKDRIKITPKADSNVQLGLLRFPPSLQKMDKQGHTYPIYKNQLSLPVSILGEKPGETVLDLQYQGCSDEGFCYPPEKRQIKVAIDDKLALSQVNLESPGTQFAGIKEAPEDTIGRIFVTHNWAIILIIFFGLGLLLSFTPCILPMIPVLSGIIVGHGKSVTTKKAFFLSLSYVLSMSVTYAIFGAIVALLGANLQVSMQSPWAISLFSLIFILLAFSMFGFYEFKLPNSWQSKIAGSSRSQRGGHYWGAAFMGCLSTLILSPCVTAPLIGVLTYIAQTGNVLTGSLTLFFLSLGMGTPLLLIGTSAGKWLPESGEWMNAVKAFFGIMLIAIAIYLMARILPEIVSMGLWSCLLIFSGIYAGALTPSLTGQEKMRQGVGIITLAYGLLILAGLSTGATNPLQPLGSLRTTSSASTELTPKATSLAVVKQTIAESLGKPVMIDFYANWCASCKIMEATTFRDARVQEAMSHFSVIKIDVTANNTNDKELLNHFNIIAPPAFVFFNAEGEQLHPLTMVGERSADEFLNNLNTVSNTH